ncbi:hypothetical protein ACFC5X_29365 [Streptomyces sp. NPDC055952]
MPAERAAGRVSAEMLSPYPPGVPAIAPGARCGSWREAAPHG